jgi:surface protein
MSTIYTLNGKVLKNSANDKWLIKAPTVDPYNPLGLPPFTIRCKFKSGYTPTKGDSQTLVDAEENIWDITKNSTDWHDLLAQSWNDGQYPLLEVLGANTTGVTNMYCLFGYAGTSGQSNLTKVALFDTSSVTNMQQMFQRSRITTIPLFDTSSVTNMNSMFGSCTSLVNIPLIDTSKVSNMSYVFAGCSSLTTVPLFDTSSCTNMMSMFQNCSSLTTVPLFDTSSCTYMSYMFYSCYNVQSGALALYQQASTQANPPSSHSLCFTNCGRDTVTGAAELAQIPSSWGGTGA